MTTSSDSSQTELDKAAIQLDEEATQQGLSEAQYKRKMERRKQVQDQRLSERKVEKGLVIVNTGNGKGKTLILSTTAIVITICHVWSSS